MTGQLHTERSEATIGTFAQTLPLATRERAVIALLAILLQVPPTSTLYVPPARLANTTPSQTVQRVRHVVMT